MFPPRAHAAVELSFPLRLRRGPIQLFWIRQWLGPDVLGFFNSVDGPPPAHRLGNAVHQHWRRWSYPIAICPVELFRPAQIGTPRRLFGRRRVRGEAVVVVTVAK